MEVLQKAERKKLMRRIRSRDTKPELLVRKYLHRQGYRYRLHVKEMPGTPDMVLPRWRVVIEVRGCFWHQHRYCLDAGLPKTNSIFWREKLLNNRVRDEKNEKLLQASGWRICIMWTCALKSKASQHRYLQELIAFLQSVERRKELP